LERIRTATPAQAATFPEPHEFWLDAKYDCAAQFDAYMNLAPLAGKRVLQVGGKGLAAMVFLAAGAAEAWLITPMLGELRCARAIAQVLGFADRFHGVAAIAEELPFGPGSFDGAYAGGCVHHMVTALALPEIARILKPGGRFSAIEPWRAPLYRIGTAIFGKREVDVHCKPLTKARVQPMFDTFPAAQMIHHGTLTRYPLLACMKLGLDSRLRTVWRWNKFDDALCSAIPGMRAMGSSVALLVCK
jgi:ubiquinone/menaquinone biosynthesis C-methylase UbiE